MKVDMIFGIAIILLVLLLDRDKFEGPNARKNLKGLLILIIIAMVVIFPALLYIYAASQVSFGAPQGQPNFSLSYLINDSSENLLFWFGAYDKVYVQIFNSYYYDEFPLTYTIFAIIGGFAFLHYRKYREFTLLALWFFVVFVFYTSYYAGGVNYGAGDDVRYFTSAFPVIAILAAYGFLFLYNFISGILSGGKNAEEHKNKRGRIKYVTFIIMLIILFGESLWFFATIVTISPYHIYPFAAERYDERFIMQNYKLIPSNCFVLTFKPPLWYILGRGNIYAGWVNESSYNRELLNMSKGCLYFDYSISCYINFTGPPNTAQQCLNIVRTYRMQPIASMHLDNYSWNVSMYLYKIIGLNNT